MSQINTYYFDGSGGISDPNNVWFSDANGFDNNEFSSTYTNNSGTFSNNYLQGKGTSSPTTGGTITQVRARVYLSQQETGNITTVITTSNYTETLATITDDTIGWTAYTTLSEPTGGWTWQKIRDLESRTYCVAAIGGAFRVIEIEVTDESVVPSVTSVSSSSITSTQARLDGSVESDGGESITERGFVYSTTSNPTTSDNKVVGAATTPYWNIVTGLTHNTTYYWRAYAINSIGIGYGGEENFTTLPLPATLTTNGADNITTTTADVISTIESNGGGTITERGVVYALTTNPTVADTKVIVAGTTTPYTTNLTGLTEATTYYARAYAINEAGTSYGNTINFQTSQTPAPPTVVTGAAAFIADTTSQFNGNHVTLDGSEAVTERGVVFSSTETVPTTDDNKVIALTAGLGTYGLDITGLTAETTYYARAYAINSIGTGYGSVATFTTAAPFASDVGDGYWVWSPGVSQATVGRTQSTPAESCVNLPLVDLGLTDGLDYTFYFGSVDNDNGEASVVIERLNGATPVINTITAGTPYTFTYDTDLTNWNIRLYVTGASVEPDEITAVFNDLYLAQESTFSEYIPFTPRGVTEVKIINNQIVDDDRDAIISSMFDQVSGIEWYPFEIATEGLGYFEIGDRFTITDDQNVDHSVVVWNSKLTLDGGIKETLYTNKPDVVDTDYSKAGNTRLRGNIRKTSLQVDQQAGTIEALVSDMYDLDGVVNTIYTELQQDNDSITATVQGAGGSNLLKNSVMYAFDNNGNPESWTMDVSSPGSLTIQASNESLAQGAVSGNHFTLEDMTVTQRVTVRKNVEFIAEEDKVYYSISARVKKKTVGTAWIKLINRNETLTIELPDQTSYFWDVVQLEEILPLDDYFDIEIYSDADADLQVTDLMFSPGKTRKQWSQANGEVMNSSVAITTEGITVRSSAFTNNYTTIDALGFEVHKQSASGARVFGFNDDETNVSKLKVDEQISMAPLRAVPINYGTYQGWAFTISEDN